MKVFAKDELRSSRSDYTGKALLHQVEIQVLWEFRTLHLKTGHSTWAARSLF